MPEVVSAPDAQTADSSPALDVQQTLDALTPDQRHSWELTGKLPTASDASADSSPAPSGDQSAATAVKPLSADSEPAARPKKGVQARSAQLDAEISALQEKLRIRAALREEMARTEQPPAGHQADSAPAKPRTADWARYAAHPESPKEDDFADYREFVAAMGAFVADQRFTEREARARGDLQLFKQIESVERMATEARKRVETYAQADPDFAEKVSDDLLAIKAVSQLDPREPIQPWNVLAEEVLTSSATAPLLVYFSTPDGQKEWARLCAMRPGEMLRAFGRIEARFEAPSTERATKRTVPSAPDPPMTVGRKPSAPIDEVQAALEQGDFAAFERVQNAREMAAAR